MKPAGRRPGGGAERRLMDEARKYKKLVGVREEDDGWQRRK